MPEQLQCVSPDSIIVGWDFSTGAVKFLAFNLKGQTLAKGRLTTDQWIEKPKGKKLLVKELHLCQLEGQAVATIRSLARQLRQQGLLSRWVAGGISATHHTAGRIDHDALPVRRAICWNDQTLAEFHALGLERLGGQDKVKALIGGPWASRYTLSHLVKDEVTLKKEDWQRTHRILSHGSLAAGYLTGNFEVCSVSSAASTGIMNLHTDQWCEGMLAALQQEEYRRLAWQQLPRIIDQYEAVGHLSAALTVAADLHPAHRPLIFPTSDDQQAGLVGGGAVDPGEMAIVLGNSAVVNSSSDRPPATPDLDCMKLNWGRFLWMRCYNNGAQFLDKLVGKNPPWDQLDEEGSRVPAGCEGINVLPFSEPEPSLGVAEPLDDWHPKKPTKRGVKFRAALEAIAYLIALGVRAHQKAGQNITRISVSGGIARSRLMLNILATVLNRELYKVQSDEGPALGAAVTALASLETYLRRQKGNMTPFTVADAVACMVQFEEEPIRPREEWKETYQKGLQQFEERLARATGGTGQNPASRGVV